MNIPPAMHSIILASRSSCSILFSASFFASLASGIWAFSKRHPGILLVLVGVAGEVFFGWAAPKNRREVLEKFCAVLLVVGLVVEIVEASKEDKQIATANVLAAQANEVAGKANERAAEIEKTEAMIEQTNLLLRSNFIALKMQNEPRHITPEQLTNFVFLTEKVTKIPITVSIGPNGFDTETFAFQLRQMLSMAGFGTNKGDVWGIEHSPTRLSAHLIGTPSPGNFDLTLLIPSKSSDAYRSAIFHYSFTNGFRRPDDPSTNEATIWSELGYIFKLDGFLIDAEDNGWDQSFEVYVPIKNQF